MARITMIGRAKAQILRDPKEYGLEDDYNESDLFEAIDELMHQWQREAAEDREIFGEPEDTPCIESGRDNCDDWGTGEGQYHGRI